MIYTVNDEFRIIILLVAYGIYLFFISDFIKVFTNKISKKFIKHILSIMLWCMQIYISYIFVYRMQDGYIPLYFILFIFIGFIIYLFIRNKTIKLLSKIISIFYNCLIIIYNLIKEAMVPDYLKVIIIYNKKRLKNKKIKDIIVESKKDN